jgi:hypothetical protein
MTIQCNRGKRVQVSPKYKIKWKFIAKEQVGKRGKVIREWRITKRRHQG